MRLITQHNYRIIAERLAEQRGAPTAVVERLLESLIGEEISDEELSEMVSGYFSDLCRQIASPHSDVEVSVDDNGRLFLYDKNNPSSDEVLYLDNDLY